MSTDPRQVRDEKMVLLLRHLFHTKFCPVESVPSDKKMHVIAAYFCGWLDRNMPMMDPAIECEEANVELEIWENIRAMLDNGTAPEALFGVWYSIVLSDRPDPLHELQSINVVVNLTFSDKTISISQALVSQEMFAGEKFTDHVVAGIIRQNSRALLEKICETGLDGLHAEAQKNQFTSTAPEDPFEVLMGWILKHMIGGVPMPGVLREELKKPILNYMRLAQQCIRPPIPKHVLEAAKARYAREQRKKSSDTPRGGWDA